MRIKAYDTVWYNIILRLSLSIGLHNLCLRQNLEKISYTTFISSNKLIITAHVFVLLTNRARGSTSSHSSWSTLCTFGTLLSSHTDHAYLSFKTILTRGSDRSVWSPISGLPFWSWRSSVSLLPWVAGLSRWTRNKDSPPLIARVRVTDASGLNVDLRRNILRKEA